MKRYLGGLLFLVLATIPQRASALTLYAPWIYTVGSADTIVAGRVVEADIASHEQRYAWNLEEKPEPTFRIVVDDVIAGTCSVGDKISVRHFHRDSCGAYLVCFPLGQRVLLFLARGEDSKSPYLRLDESLIVAADDQEYVVGTSTGEEMYWKHALPYREYRTAIADFRVSFRFVYLPMSELFPARVGTTGFHNPGLLPCSRIDYVASDPAPTTFRKRYPPGVASPIVPFKDRSAAHAMLVDKVREEQRRIKLYFESVDSKRTAKIPSL